MLAQLIGLADDAVILGARTIEVRPGSPDNLTSSQVVSRRRPRQTAGLSWDEVRWESSALLSYRPEPTYLSGRLRRGETLPGASGSVFGAAAYPFLYSSARFALPLAAPFLYGPLRVGAAFLAAVYGSDRLASSVRRGVRYASDRVNAIRRLEMGGSYEDTATARAGRERAILDMSSAFPAARTYLGREAEYFRSSPSRPSRPRSYRTPRAGEPDATSYASEALWYLV